MIVLQFSNTISKPVIAPELNLKGNITLVKTDLRHFRSTFFKRKNGTLIKSIGSEVKIPGFHF